MNIITGRTGTPHVTSQQQRDTNAAIFGREDCVLNVGREFEAEVIASNTVRIYDGQLSMQGCIASIDPNEYEDVVLSPGNIGYYRKDLIVARYTKTQNESEEYVESVELCALENNLSYPIATPQLSAGLIVDNTTSIRDGATEYIMPLYEVVFEGVSIKSITPKFITGGWHLLPLQSEFDHYSNDQSLKYRKRGSLVEIRGAVRTLLELPVEGINTEYTIGNLPEELAPSSIIVRPCQGSTTCIWMLEIVGTRITVSRYRRGETLLDNIPLNTWLPIQLTYLID